MIVSFDDYGNPMPYKAIEVSLEDFREFFTGIDDREERSELFRKLEMYISRFQEEVAPDSLWIMLFDGSYTTTKTHPNDIDFVSIIDVKTVEEKEKELKALTTCGQLDEGYDIREHWRLDAYFVPFFPPDDERFILSAGLIVYWVRWFGLDREKRPKAVFVVKFKNEDEVLVGGIVLQHLQNENFLQTVKSRVSSQRGNSGFTLEEIRSYLDW